MEVDGGVQYDMQFPQESPSTPEGKDPNPYYEDDENKRFIFRRHEGLTTHAEKGKPLAKCYWDECAMLIKDLGST